MKKTIIFLFVIGSYANSVCADTFENTKYEVCFTPYQNCTQSITQVIEHAEKTILVQVYSFTSRPIAKALVNAKNRGVDVKIIFDKSQYAPNRYSSARFFTNQGIPGWIDDKVMNAHNKVMIIDDSVVITGSFNFTRAAQYKNTENVLIIWDKSLAKKYSENWMRRLRESQSVQLTN